VVIIFRRRGRQSGNYGVVWSVICKLYRKLVVVTSCLRRCQFYMTNILINLKPNSISDMCLERICIVIVNIADTVQLVRKSGLLI